MNENGFWYDAGLEWAERTSTLAGGPLAGRKGDALVSMTEGGIVSMSDAGAIVCAIYAKAAVDKQLSSGSSRGSLQLKTRR